MRFSSILVLVAILASVVGCGDPPRKAEPMAVKGSVVGPDGKPVGYVTLNLFPTSPEQIQGGAQLKADGKFEAKLLPGKHRFTFEGSAAAMKVIPTKYHTPSEENVIEVTPNTDVQIKLTK
jgi:hypothetical protein